MQISKHIDPLHNADETYYIDVKYDYCLTSSLNSVYDEIKNLLAILTNEKGKFYYKIESLISASYLHKNKDTIRKIK